MKWEFNPGVVIPLAISALLYARGSRVQRIAKRREVLCFWCGWIALGIALVSPLHPLGEQLFSAHMIQHEILMLVAAPLFVLSRPLVTFLWGMPFSWRRALGQWSKTDYVRRSWFFLTAPIVAWWVHLLPYGYGTHLFSLMPHWNELAHSAQHVSFLFSALLFWWALFYAPGRKSYGAAVFYIFTTSVHTSILGALLTFSPHVWYASYENTTRAWGLTPLEDQQIGGLVMWVPAGIVYLVAGLWLFAAWLKESDAMLERTHDAE